MSVVLYHNLELGKEYIGIDGHKRIVESVEDLYGNVSIRVRDNFLNRPEWISVPEWNLFNPLHKIVRNDG